MFLDKKYIRDGKRQIIGSVTTGYAAEQTVVRDSTAAVTGRASGLFNTTRDGNGSLVSINSADPGLVIKQKK